MSLYNYIIQCSVSALIPRTNPSGSISMIDNQNIKKDFRIGETLIFNVWNYKKTNVLENIQLDMTILEKLKQ